MGALMNKRSITPGLTGTVTAVLAALAATFSTVAAANHDEADALREQVDTLTATLDGQYDVNADYADQIASLTDQLADAQQAAKQVTATPAPKLRMYEDGSWVMGKQSGCAPSALCDDEYQDSLIANVPSHLATWEGFRVGEVILCPKGWDVSIDDAEDGQQWAACM